MRIPTTPYRAILLDSSASRLFRSISTTPASNEKWNRSDNSSSSRSQSKAKQYNERRRQLKVSDTLLTASRLGDQASSISKEDSDRYSGWKPTPGPSTRRNVGRPKLSHPAAKSLNKAKADESIETLLGPHSAKVITTPLLAPSGDEDVFGGRPEGGRVGSRDFITPRRQLKPGDFVDVRRQGVSVGIVLPPPPDDTESQGKVMRDLYVLVTSGQIVLYKENDVMMQIPSFIDFPLTSIATPTSKRYVVSTNSLDAPSNPDGSHDAHSSNTGGEVDPTEGSAIEEEPVDVARFEARATICNKLRLLERQKEKELQRLLPSFQSLFLVPQLAADRGRMDVRTGSITTFEAARLMFEHCKEMLAKKGKEEEGWEMTASTVYAAHSLLMAHPTHFLADALSHRTSQLFSCRSEGERANHVLVSSWNTSPPGSEGQAYISAFCEKARKIRKYHESHSHNPSGEPRIIPAPTPDLDITWTKEDREIIEFLQTSLGSRRELQEDTHGSISMSLIKRAGGHFRVLPHPNSHELMSVDSASDLLVAEEEEGGKGLGRVMLELIGTDLHASLDLQHGLVMRFLTEIGALPPWQNPIRLDAAMRSAIADDPEPEVEAPTATKAGKGVAKKHSLTLDQEVENIRHDWGKDHSVYVIDDESAFELDDGISISPLAGQDKAWVHVHIADPTALVQPGGELGRRAERRFTTIYFPEARWAMLPDSFVSSGAGLRASTGTDGGRAGEGQRVMTFSALIDLQSGLVEDTTVKPGLVHDVQTISYDKVSSLLSQSPGTTKGKKEEELRLLLKAATLLSENRTKATAFVAYRFRSSISVSPLPLPSLPVSASALQKPYFFAGFPTISVSPASDSPAASGATPPLAHFLVSELMVLAGRIAASFGTQHNLPLAYRYQHAPESPEEVEAILGMRSNLPGDGTLVSENGMVGHGLIPFEDLLVQGHTLSAGGYSSSADDHFSLGITGSSDYPASGIKDALTGGGYTRATSPLRRYIDMLGHWQLKHHLIHDKPRFKHGEIDTILPQLERQEATARQLMRSADRFWLHTLLQRSLLEPNFASQGGREWLKGPFTAKVVLPEVRINAATLLGRVRVQVDELGTPADLEWGAGEAAPELGAVFKAEPVAVIMAGMRSGLVLRRA